MAREGSLSCRYLKVTVLIYCGVGIVGVPGPGPWPGPSRAPVTTRALSSPLVGSMIRASNQVPGHLVPACRLLQPKDGIAVR
jgi:hypothetical protein